MKYVLIFRFFIFLGLYYPIYILLKNKITKPEITNISAKVRCLMLSPEKFRGDFYELSKRSDMAIYRFSLLWLSRLYLTFYNKVNSKKNIIKLGVY